MPHISLPLLGHIFDILQFRDNCPSLRFLTTSLIDTNIALTPSTSTPTPITFSRFRIPVVTLIGDWFELLVLLSLIIIVPARTSVLLLLPRITMVFPFHSEVARIAWIQVIHELTSDLLSQHLIAIVALVVFLPSLAWMLIERWR